MSNEAPPWPRIDSPLDGVNDDFHDSYDTVRSSAVEAAPVLIFIDDTLVVYQRGERRSLLVTPRLYHAIKSASHAPIALYAILYPLGDKLLDDATVRRLGALREHTEASLGALSSDISSAEILAELRPLLTATLSFLDRMVQNGRAASAALTEFARSCGPSLLHLIDQATGVQLDALHACVEEVLAQMTPAEKDTLQVVVAGPHQARERSVAMQYFRKRLHEPDHFEERVAYAENAADEQAALTLVGTRRFDRALAGAFFGDERRMQRDLLGDAAASRLGAITFPPVTR
jgi:hypothetical protein